MACRFLVAAISPSCRRVALLLCLSITRIACGYSHRKYMKTTRIAGQVRRPVPPAANTIARPVPEAVTYPAGLFCHPSSRFGPSSTSPDGNAAKTLAHRPSAGQRCESSQIQKTGFRFRRGSPAPGQAGVIGHNLPVNATEIVHERWLLAIAIRVISDTVAVGVRRKDHTSCAAINLRNHRGRRTDASEVLSSSAYLCTPWRRLRRWRTLLSRQLRPVT